MSADIDARVEAALHDRKARRHGDKIDFLCVACDDGTNPAACWERRRDVWGCAKCGAGGNTRDLAKRLGIPVEDRPAVTRIVATYDYRDEQGNLAFQVVRKEPKAFMQRRPDGAGGWIWKRDGTDPILYRLPELLASDDRRVYLPEGEKDVDNIRERGGTATCNPGGASETGKSKWYPQRFNKYLRDREVVILPDRDKAGDNHAAFVAESLLGTAASVKVLELPGLEWRQKRGPDVSDWFALGGTFEELEQLADECPEWEKPKEPVGLASFPRTDAGNAELFAHIYGDEVRYDHLRGRWLVWDVHRWGPDHDGALWRWAVTAARERAKAALDVLTGDQREQALKWAIASESAGKVEAMMKHLRAVEPVADRGLAWDANPMLLGVANGVVNLATGELRPGEKNDRITLGTELQYNPDAPCPRWLQFLDEVFAGRQDLIEFIQRAAGYSLTGSTVEQVVFLCYGTGANGKSTFLNILRAMAGEYGHNMAFSTIEKGKEQSIPSDMAALVGKRVVTASETAEAARLNEARIKALTGSDPITARELYQKQFTFEPALKLWLAVNHKPNVHDDSEGFWRRMRLIPFTEKFQADRRDDHIEDRLKEELPGILAWAIEGAVKWHESGLTLPPIVAVATTAYREESDPLAAFIADCCIEREGAWVQAGEFYQAYTRYMARQGYGERERLSNTKFGTRMGDRFERGKRGGQRAYLDIGLRPDDEWGQPVPGGRVAGSGRVDDPKPAMEPHARAEVSAERVQPVHPSPDDITGDGADGDGERQPWEDFADE